MRAARVDANHTAVVSALRAAGCLVESLAGVGKGVPDLLVAYESNAGECKFAMFEIKDGQKSKSAQALTDAQKIWHKKYDRWPVCLVDSPETALRHLNVLKS